MTVTNSARARSSGGQCSIRFEAAILHAVAPNETQVGQLALQLSL